MTRILLTTFALASALIAAAYAQILGGNTSLAVTTTASRAQLPASLIRYPYALIIPAPHTVDPTAPPQEIFYSIGNASVTAMPNNASLPSGGICLNLNNNGYISAIVSSGTAKLRITQLSACALFSTAALAWPVHGSAGSPNAMKVGTNLTAGFDAGTVELPFINLMKTSAQWTPLTGTPGAWVNAAAQTFATYTSWLDSDLYVTTFAGAPFTGLGTTALAGWPSPYYKSGIYIFLYDGTCSFDFLNDGAYVSGAGTGRIVLNVTPSAQGIAIVHYATGSGGARCTNFRLVYGADEAALAGGEIFNPDFTARQAPYKTYRHMKWGGIDAPNFQVNWSDRTLPSNVFWTGGRLAATNYGANPSSAVSGVPVEIMVALCNKISADCWFNMPAMASDDYITQFATLVHAGGGGFAGLSSGLKAYVEPANELWNLQLGTQFVGTITASASGTTLTVTDLTPNGFGGPYLLGGPTGLQIDDGGISIPNDNTYMIAGQLGGTPGGVGTYSLSRAVTFGSQSITVNAKGTTNVAHRTEQWFPFLVPGNYTADQLNKFYANAFGPHTFALWKAAWGADAGKVTRVFGGWLGNNQYNLDRLPSTVANTGAESSAFTGTITGTDLETSGVSGTTVIGHLVSGAGVAPATYIQSGSGTSWVVNKSQNVGPVAMTSQAWVGTVASNSDALCVAGYFGDTGTVVPNTATLDQLFQEILSGGLGWTNEYPGGMLKQTSDLTAVSVATAANPSYGNGLDVLVYEGGWSLVAGSDSALNTLYINAQSDSRMYTVFKTLLANEQTNGVKTFINFTDINPHIPSPFGFDWGALSTVLSSPSQRYSALLDFSLSQ